MANILVINPPFMDGRFSRESRSPAITKSGTIYYPLWLIFGVAALEKAGNRVVLLDAPANGSTLDDIISQATGFAPDLLVVNTSTPSIYADAEFARDIKKELGSPLTVLVGTHVTARPEDGLAEDTVDICCLGEYDLTLPALAAALDSGADWRDVKGIAYRSDDGEIVKNEKQPLLEELDGGPFLAEIVNEHLDVSDYFFAAARYPMIMMITGRGCPHQCVFCLYPQVFHGHKYRLRSAEDVVAEFEYIKTELPRVREVVIEDDTFTANKRRVREICEMLIERKVRMMWSSNVRVNLDYETMRFMKRAGCRLIIAGFESGDQNVLDRMQKGITVEQQRAFMRSAKRAGLLVHGCFMAGTSGETRNSMQRTLDFALELNPDTAQFFPLMVYPGTGAYDWAERGGYLTTEDYREWLDDEGMHNCVVSTDNLSAQELVDFCNYARKRYYLRFGYMLRKAIQAIINPYEGLRTLRSFKTFAKHLLGKG
ncbi:MAG: radical SAM protein [bacterium]|nr:radical SAM protein [bacterium]